MSQHDEWYREWQEAVGQCAEASVGEGVVEMTDNEMEELQSVPLDLVRGLLAQIFGDEVVVIHSRPGPTSDDKCVERLAVKIGSGPGMPDFCFPLGDKNDQRETY